MAYCCKECGKIIKGKVVITSPTILEITLGIACPAAYHPACYDRLEKRAEKELRGTKAKGEIT